MYKFMMRSATILLAMIVIFFSFILPESETPIVRAQDDGLEWCHRDYSGACRYIDSGVLDENNEPFQEVWRLTTDGGKNCDNHMGNQSSESTAWSPDSTKVVYGKQCFSDPEDPDTIMKPTGIYLYDLTATDTDTDNAAKRLVANRRGFWSYPIFDHKGEYVYYYDEGYENNCRDGTSKCYFVKRISVNAVNAADGEIVLEFPRATEAQKITKNNVEFNRSGEPLQTPLFAVHVSENKVDYKTVIFKIGSVEGQTVVTEIPGWKWAGNHGEAGADGSIWHPTEPYQIYASRTNDGGPIEDANGIPVRDEYEDVIYDVYDFIWEVDISGNASDDVDFMQPRWFFPKQYFPLTDAGHMSWHPNGDVTVRVGNNVHSFGDGFYAGNALWGETHPYIDQSHPNSSDPLDAKVLFEIYGNTAADDNPEWLKYLYAPTLNDLDSNSWQDDKIVSHLNIRLSDQDPDLIKLDPHPQFSPDGKYILWQSNSLRSTDAPAPNREQYWGGPKGHEEYDDGRYHGMDIYVARITERTPSNGESVSNPIEFRWPKTDGVETYRLLIQIPNPDGSQTVFDRNYRLNAENCDANGDNCPINCSPACSIELTDLVLEAGNYTWDVEQVGQENDPWIGRIDFNVTDPTPTFLLGDVDCDQDIDSVDALFTLQYAVDLRADHGSCPLDDRATQLFAANGDMNSNGRTDAVDAWFILQCAVDIPNVFCPDAATEVMAAAVKQTNNPDAVALNLINSDVSITLDAGNSAVGAGTITLTYDANSATLLGCTRIIEESTCNIAVPGVVRLAFVSIDGLNGSHPLANLTFNNESAVVTGWTISTMTDLNGDDIDAGISISDGPDQVEVIYDDAAQNGWSTAADANILIDPNRESLIDPNNHSVKITPQRDWGSGYLQNWSSSNSANRAGQLIRFTIRNHISDQRQIQFSLQGSGALGAAVTLEFNDSVTPVVYEIPAGGTAIVKRLRWQSLGGDSHQPFYIDNVEFITPAASATPTPIPSAPHGDIFDNSVQNGWQLHDNQDNISVIENGSIKVDPSQEWQSVYLDNWGNGINRAGQELHFSMTDNSNQSRQIRLMLTSNGSLGEVIYDTLEAQAGQPFIYTLPQSGTVTIDRLRWQAIRDDSLEPFYIDDVKFVSGTLTAAETQLSEPPTDSIDNANSIKLFLPISNR